jgi:hypothetical protein
LLAKAPAERFQTAAEVAAALLPFAQSDATALVRDGSAGKADAVESALAPGAPTVTAAAPSLPPRVAGVRADVGTPGPRARPWWLAPAGAGLLVILVVLVLVLAWRKRNGSTEAPGGDERPPPPRRQTPAAQTWRGGPVLDVTGVRAVALNPLGTKLAVACGEKNRLDKPGEIQLWQVDRNKPTKITGYPLDFAGRSVAFSTNGKLLAWAAASGKNVLHPVIVWNLEDNKRRDCHLGLLLRPELLLPQKQREIVGAEHRLIR